VKLLLVDGHYHAYRAFFAIRDLANSRGEPTNAIFGFVKAIRRMLRDLAPDAGAVIWDGGIPARRLELVPGYKAQRAEMPDALRQQLDALQDIAPALGLTSIEVPETEADDLMASYAVAAEREGGEAVLATNDKDLFQVVSERVRVYSTHKTDLAAPGAAFALLGPEAVAAKWGVPPNRIADALSLVGDSADNIPGIDGLGPKTAAQLIREFGGVRELLARSAEIANARVRAKVEEGRDRILANLEMVTLDRALPLPVPLDALGVRPDPAALLPVLERCEFKSLTAEVRAELVPPPAPQVQGELFG
jgi:DNA polymerase-1